MRTLVWFRSDLRRADNTALADACISSPDGVVGLFLLSPVQWRRDGWGAPRVDFVLRAVASLSERLQAWGVPLLIRTIATHADAPSTVTEVLRETGCIELIHHHEYGADERTRDAAVAQVCRAAGVQVRAYHDQVCVPPGMLKTRSDRVYSVYKPFRRTWHDWLDSHGWPTPQGDPRRPKPVNDIVPDPVPESVDGFAKPVCADRWTVSESEATARLKRFLPGRIASYDSDRDRYDRDGTSSLSPYLAAGVLAQARCVFEVRPLTETMSAAREGARAWLDELVWREFYRHVRVGYPHIETGDAFRPKADILPWTGEREAFDRWCEGRTGFPIIDGAMRQLARTGWMHNRLRMITAMFLSKDLMVDWRLGERHFMATLVDADWASNNGGWQWSAGCGTDAAPFHRVFNPETQSRRFDPEGAFLKRWLPELEPLGKTDIHAPWSVAGPVRDTIDYPERVVHHAAARGRYLLAAKEARLLS